MLPSAAYHFSSFFWLDDRITMVFNMVKFKTLSGISGHAMCCHIDFVFVHAHRHTPVFCVCALRYVSTSQYTDMLYHMVTWCCFLLGLCRVFYRNSVSAKILTCSLLCMLVIHMCQALLQISWLRKDYGKLYAQYLLLFDIFILTFVLQTHFCALKAISLDEDL